MPKQKSKQQRAADEVIETLDRWMRAAKPNSREKRAAGEGFVAGLAAYAAINALKLNKTQRAFVFSRVLAKLAVK